MRILDRLKHPLFVAPMAGGPSSVELVAAASKAGALGQIGAAYLNANQIDEFTKQVRALTAAPFAINLFIQHPTSRVSTAEIEAALAATAGFRSELGLPEPTLSPPFEENFDLQFEACLRAKPAVFSYVFGSLNESYAKAARKEGIELLGAATSRAEAERILDNGADGVVLQGLEAGGHRSIHSTQADDPGISLVELLAQCRDLKIAKIAAGGLMRKEQIATALAHGAEAVQLGTAFLCCEEAGTSQPYRARLLAGGQTGITRAFSGRLARGLENRFLLEMEDRARLPFPLQNKFTRDLRGLGNSDFLSLWCGTGPRPLFTGKAKDLIAQLF